ncbi:hypothetical protein J5751_05010 [bacterium]|nr:hypothetical protein [bacterium]
MSSIYEIIRETKKNMFDKELLLNNYIETLIMRIDDEEDREQGDTYDRLQGAKDVLISIKNFIENLEEIRE